MALSTISSWDPIWESYTEDICLDNCFCVLVEERLVFEGELERSIDLLEDDEDNTRDDGDWGWLDVLLNFDNCNWSPWKPETYAHRENYYAIHKSNKLSSLYKH